MLEGEINSFKSIRASKRRKNMPSYWFDSDERLFIFACLYVNFFLNGQANDSARYAGGAFAACTRQGFDDDRPG